VIGENPNCAVFLASYVSLRVIFADEQLQPTPPDRTDNRGINLLADRLKRAANLRHRDAVELSGLGC
jgi:hypothetical protein